MNRSKEIKIHRFENEIMNALNHCLKFEIYDHTLRLASITYVKVDQEKTSISVFVDSYEQENLDKIIDKLNECKGVFKRYLSSVITFRKMPNIFFKKDMSILRAQKIEELIKKI